MRQPKPHRSAFTGFSLVEMLVALVFTSILMAGLATVFKTSLGGLVASSEKMSRSRRNFSAIDQLSDDLNRAGMLINDVQNYPFLSATNPPFLVIPNVAFTGTDIPTASAVTDQLIFYYDDPAPNEANMTLGVGDSNTGVLNSVSASATGTPFSMEMPDATAATQIKTYFTQTNVNLRLRGMTVPFHVVSANTSGNLVTGFMEMDAKKGAVKTFDSSIIKIAAGTTTALFYRSGRYIRYSIQPRNLDPDPANAANQVPCLVRDEVSYDTVQNSVTPFAAPDTSTIIAENVTGFQVMLSGNGGNSWAGGNAGFTKWKDMTDVLNGVGQLANYGRPNANSTDMDPFWFREIPVLVRVDLKTRTVRQRTEYANSPTTAGYAEQTQSLVLVPRHFGLAFKAAK